MAEGEASYPVQITFRSPGARPPVYVAGSFTVPEWQPHELDYSQIRTSYTFSREFDVPAGTFQYKFRLGHRGDWWVCDSTEKIGRVPCTSKRVVADQPCSH